MSARPPDKELVAALSMRIGIAISDVTYDSEGNVVALNLSGCNLTNFPSEVCAFTHLEKLLLSNNQLRHLPADIGNLTQLQRLDVDANPDLLWPPPTIVSRGTKAILNFLRGIQGEMVYRYEAKLLVVGDADTGKSSLLRALRGETFLPEKSRTEGVELSTYTFPHPQAPKVDVVLNTWDFGGQEIHYKMHQFFFSSYSLYLLVWNARSEAKPGQLEYWLDTIRTLAPDAPVLLVATHMEDMPTSMLNYLVNFQRLQHEYPQLIDHVGLSNQTSEGLDMLKAILHQQVLKMPTMGLPWPQSWRNAESELLARLEYYLEMVDYLPICTSQQIERWLAENALAPYLHYLGKLLYFQDDHMPRSLVILKPEWLSKAIGRVFLNEGLQQHNGLFTDADLPSIWATNESGLVFEPHFYYVFLYLMENFSLCYRLETTNSQRAQRLIPHLLSHESSSAFPAWSPYPPEKAIRLELLYDFQGRTPPTNLVSWLIVHTHHYTQLHCWRHGIELEEQNARARIEFDPDKKVLHLQAQGQFPSHFFFALKGLIDSFLNLFPGIDVKRVVPCICHYHSHQKAGDLPCPRSYFYDDLERFLTHNRYEIDCPKSMLPVSILQLLYGLRNKAEETVLALLRDQKMVLQDIWQSQVSANRQHEALAEQMDRNFTSLWNLGMEMLKPNCPSSFLLTLAPSNRWSGFIPKNWVSQEYRIFLVCQHMQGVHVVGDGYPVREAAEWWATISPLLTHAAETLKVVVPIAKAFLALHTDGTAIKQMQADLGIMEEIAKLASGLQDLNNLQDVVLEPTLGRQQEVTGAALRALYRFLQKVDPEEKRCGLERKLTATGSLWLCKTHWQLY